MRSYTSFGASVSLGERANISAGPRLVSPLTQVLSVPACAACMLPRSHGRGTLSVTSFTRCNRHRRSNEGRWRVVFFALFVFVACVLMRLFCTRAAKHCLLTLSHYFLGAHVTAMPEAFTIVAHFSHGNLDQSFTEKTKGFIW